MRLQLYLSSLLAIAASHACARPACAQGIVNQSLLAAPTERAVATWTTTTFEKVQGSVVYVGIEVDGPRGKFVLGRSSSGVVVDASGLVLTFHHLVKQMAGATDKRLFVQLNDAKNTQVNAKVVGHDKATGLALLRFTKPADVPLQPVSLSSDRPDIGEPLLVVARPHGEDMLAFEGVASNSLATVTFAGQQCAPGDLFLTDARNDQRCDGGAAFAADGTLLGLYATEHVRNDPGRDATIKDLGKPSFGVVVPCKRIRGAFRSEFGAASNATLKTSQSRAPHTHALAVRKVAPSVVGVCSQEGDWPAMHGKDPGAAQRRLYLGSGVVVTKSGLVVANAHICNGDMRVKVGEQIYPAEVLKRSGASNLALLQVELPAGKHLQPATFASNDDVQLGETILAVANPLGTDVTVTGGVISAMRAREGGRIQADADLGNSNGGGAIIDAAGRVVGIGDGGRTDPLDFALLRDREVDRQPTNLKTFLGIRKVRQVFRGILDEEAAVDESIASPVAATAAEQSVRKSALQDMVKATSGALLNIYIAKNAVVPDPDDPFPPDPVWVPMSLGSGVIIDKTGLAVSNWHVVDAGTNADGSSNEKHRITARVFSGKEYEVKVLSISREDDLSLIQLVLDEGEEVPFVELGNSEDLGIGEAVAAIGNPHGRANTITAGVVSAKGQGIRVRGRFHKLKHLIETDAAINGGNSGGALLDMNGRLVGINSAGGGTLNNVGYAIAVDHVRKQITGLLLTAKKLRSPDLGMRLIDDAGKVLVMDVDGRGPAALAGIKSGDRITALAGTQITWSPGFAKTLMQQSPGVAVTLALERAGSKQEVKVTPLAPAAWGLILQSGIRARNFAFVEDPDRVRKACIATHRGFTGDKTGEPQSIPAQVVRVERVFEQDQGNPDLKPGDLLLGVELTDPKSGRTTLTSVGSVEQVRDLFNDRLLGKPDGVDHYKVATEYPMWVARGDEVVRMNVRSVRLFW